MAAKHLLATKGPEGKVTYADIQSLRYSRRTAVWVAKRLCGLKILAKLSDGKGGRGKEAVFQVTWGFSPKTVKTKTLTSKDIKHSKDYPASPSKSWGISQKSQTSNVNSLPVRGTSTAQQPKKTTADYQGLEAHRVQLVLGARFYKAVMESTRLNLEQWSLSEPVRHALEGLIGDRLDGMSLADARELVGRITALRGEIERLAKEGATPRRICSFVAGRLAGRPDFTKSKRAVLRQTNELVKRALAPTLLERRIAGLERFLAEREAEQRDGRACKRCGYVHNRWELEEGWRKDGQGPSCFGGARVKLADLREELKKRQRFERGCSVCGGSLRRGWVKYWDDGAMCLDCHEQRRERLRQVWQQAAARPANQTEIGDLRMLALLNGPDLAAATAGPNLSTPDLGTSLNAENAELKSESARCLSCGTPGTWAYSLCDRCRRAMVRRALMH